MDLSGHDNARLRYEVFDIHFQDLHCETFVTYIHFQDLHCETFVTSNSDVVENWAMMVMEIVEPKIMVGLSTSWSPAAGADPNGVLKPCLLQLCFDDKCKIFELWRKPNSHCPEALLKLFASTNVYFFGFDIRRNEGPYQEMSSLAWKWVTSYAFV
ncbi:hypothetical protein F0562_030609 [Nyssa sinensis]|uniref:Uncharacterized protein n=1 Tax=Nyssa sinensis TaxID=561372 RepID=A0A5J5B0A5_9ASTE|nr:hypothetical protein F0562_030609 [Nyssa sinensis]